MMVASDKSGGVVLANDIDSVKDAAIGDHYAKTVGRILVKKYPEVVWHVRVNVAMGKAGITIPAVSRRHGIEVALSRNVEDLEKRVTRVGGEMLERFNISRVTGDTSHLVDKKNVVGEHASAKKGEI